MRTLSLIATIVLAISATACDPGADEPSSVPGPQPGPQPGPYSYQDGGTMPADGQAPPLDTSPAAPAPQPQPGAKCAPVKQYSGAAKGSIDANIPLLGKQKMPVECQVKFAVQGSGTALKAVGTVQVIDPQTKKPWVYAPKPFTFQADVKCNQMTGPLKGNISALGLQVAFSGTIQGAWDGSTFKGTWTGGANTGVTAQGGGTWNAKP